MRVLVAVAAFRGLSSGELGRRIAGGWAQAETTVLPVGEAGDGFLAAWSERWAADVRAAASLPDGLLADAGSAWAAAVRPHASAAAPPPGDRRSLLGRLLGDLLDSPAESLILEVGHRDADADAGAGLLGATGATADVPLDRGVAGLTGISRLDLAPVRSRLRGRTLIGVVPDGEPHAVLGGLRGITARRAATPHADRAELLATDAALTGLARLAGVDPLAPGSGACGGLGTAVLALGGELRTGPALALTEVPAAGPFDLVVTGGARFDFASRGGGVVADLARAAQSWLAPCVVLAGDVVIGSREMRTMGVEAAYELPTDSPVSAVAQRVARSWNW